MNLYQELSLRRLTIRNADRQGRIAGHRAEAMRLRDDARRSELGVLRRSVGHALIRIGVRLVEPSYRPVRSR
jgi:hypothetical protein